MKLAKLLLLLILLPVLAFGQSGKISGVITDAETGETLPGVNVVIAGTTLGSATDADGRYFIINVPPGMHEVQASMIGYATLVQEDVRVQFDRTTTVDFEMVPETLQGEEIVVTYERPRIQTDVSFTQQRMSAQDIQAIPTSPDLREAINTTAGVDRDVLGNITIRGGAYDEVGLYVNGFGANDSRMGIPQFNIARSEIEEIQVLKGGFSAEYGKTRGGIVNIVTREIGDSYSLSLDSRLRPPAQKHFGSNIFSPDNYWFVGRFLNLDPTGDRDGDGNPDFEGWRKFLEDSGGSISYDLPGFDTQTITSPEQALEIWKLQHPQWEYGNDVDWSVEGNVSGPVPLTGGRSKFSISGIYDKAFYFRPFVVPNHLDRSINLRTITKLSPDLTLRVLANWSNFQGITTGEAISGEDFDSRSDYADPRTFTNAHVLSQQQLQDGRWGALSYHMGSIAKETELGRWGTGVGLTHVLSPSTFYELKLQYSHARSQARPGPEADLTTVVANVDGFKLNELPNGFYGVPVSDIGGFYRIAEDNGRRDNSVYQGYNADLDFTSQVNNFNLIKAGVGISIEDQNLDYGIDLLRGNDDLRYLRWIRSHYTYTEGEAYVQDKIEFAGLVMNVGLRLDFFTTNAPNFTERYSKWYTQPFNYSNSHLVELGIVDQLENEGIYEAPSAQPDVKWAISPRLGISHPISESSKFFFNYGYFYQRPEIYDLSHVFMRRRNRATFIANADLDFRKTVAYEAGIEVGLSDYANLMLTGYYRDVSKEIRYVTYNGDWEGNTIGYSRPENTGYADIRGIEASVNFRLTDFIQGFVNYDYALESGGRYGYSTVYQDPNRANVRVDANIDQARARPIFKANLLFSYPESQSNSVLDQIFSDASLSSYFWYRSGVWLTYHSDNYPGIEQNNIRWSPTHNLDLVLTKGFGLPTGASMEAYVQVHNALNSKFLQPDGNTAWRGAGGLNPINRNVYLDLAAEAGVNPGSYEGTESIERYLERGMYWNMFNQPREIWIGMRLNLR